MKERPILMSPPMVRALIADEKTQTRRVLLDQREAVSAFRQSPTLWGWHVRNEVMKALPEDHQMHRGVNVFSSMKCPYGVEGDHLWVKEDWQAWTEYDALKPSDIPQNPSAILHSASRLNAPWDSRRRNARFMCRWMSRITLEITEIRVERLQSISEDDALDEGVSLLHMQAYDHERRDWFNDDEFQTFDPVRKYRLLWDTINGVGSWKSNPWVWVLTFKRVTGVQEGSQ